MHELSSETTDSYADLLRDFLGAYATSEDQTRPV